MAGMPEMQEQSPAGNFFQTLLYFARRPRFCAAQGIVELIEKHRVERFNPMEMQT